MDEDPEPFEVDDVEDVVDEFVAGALDDVEEFWVEELDVDELEDVELEGVEPEDDELEGDELDVDGELVLGVDVLVPTAPVVLDFVEVWLVVVVG